MLKKILTLIFLSSSFVISGCQTTSINLKPGVNLDDSQGAILASVTSDSEIGVFDAWFYFREEGTEKNRRLEAFGTSFSKPDDFKEEIGRDGRLLVVPVAPGSYQLYMWTLYVSRAGGYGYIYPRDDLTPLSFSVKQGEITYIGNLHLETELGKNMFGLKMAFGANPRILDRSASDIDLFKQKYSELSELNISMQVLDMEKWNQKPNEIDPNRSVEATQ